jgi:hypothetical protein
MQLNSIRSIYLLLIVLGGAILLALASLDPQATQEPNHEEGPEQGEITLDLSRTSDQAPRITNTATTSTEARVKTPEPEITTAEPEIATAEPEIVTELSTGNMNENGRSIEPGSEQNRDNSDDSYSRQFQSGLEICDWEITFEDNFEGDELDKELWDTGYKAGEHEAQYYVEDAFELKDGILRIRAEARRVDDRKYASGILTTQDIFDQRYGRFLVRAKIPAGQGLWPAFWLLPSSENYPLEIDVFEILGDQTDTVYMTNHWRDEDTGKSTFHTRGFQGPDFSQEFHIFEIIWKPGEIIWFVNGVERARETRGIPDEPMFLLLNLAVGGKWPGYPDETTPFPSYLEVDFVRVYEWTCQEEISEETD